MNRNDTGYAYDARRAFGEDGIQSVTGASGVGDLPTPLWGMAVMPD